MLVSESFSLFSACSTLWPRVTYLYNYWLDCHKMRYGFGPQSMIPNDFVDPVTFCLLQCQSSHWPTCWSMTMYSITKTNCHVFGHLLWIFGGPRCMCLVKSCYSTTISHMFYSYWAHSWSAGEGPFPFRPHHEPFLLVPTSAFCAGWTGFPFDVLWIFMFLRGWTLMGSVCSHQSACQIVKQRLKPPPITPFRIRIEGVWVQHFFFKWQQAWPLYTAIGQVCRGMKVGRTWTSLSGSNFQFFIQLSFFERTNMSATLWVPEGRLSESICHYPRLKDYHVSPWNRPWNIAIP